jgi:hypothetical protein
MRLQGQTDRRYYADRMRSIYGHREKTRIEKILTLPLNLLSISPGLFLRVGVRRWVPDEKELT